MSRANEENSEPKLISVGANHVVHIYRMTALTMIGMLLTSAKPFDPSIYDDEGEDAPTEARAEGEKDTLEELSDEDPAV